MPRRRWRWNPSKKCSQERLTRGTVTSTMRRALHPSGCARCGACAGSSAIHYQSLKVPRSQEAPSAPPPMLQRPIMQKSTRMHKSRSMDNFDAPGALPSRQVHPTESVYKVVLQKSIPASIRQLIVMIKDKLMNLYGS